MRKNIVQPVRPQAIIRRMRIACWISKATNTHSQYAKRIAPPLQQCLHERALVLRYTYIGCGDFLPYVISVIKTCGLWDQLQKFGRKM